VSMVFSVWFGRLWLILLWFLSFWLVVCGREWVCLVLRFLMLFCFLICLRMVMICFGVFENSFLFDFFFD